MELFEKKVVVGTVAETVKGLPSAVGAGMIGGIAANLSTDMIHLVAGAVGTSSTTLESATKVVVGAGVAASILHQRLIPRLLLPRVLKSEEILPLLEARHEGLSKQQFKQKCDVLMLAHLSTVGRFFVCQPQNDYLVVTSHWGYDSDEIEKIRFPITVQNDDKKTLPGAAYNSGRTIRCQFQWDEDSVIRPSHRDWTEYGSFYHSHILETISIAVGGDRHTNKKPLAIVNYDCYKGNDSRKYNDRVGESIAARLALLTTCLVINNSTGAIV